MRSELGGSTQTLPMEVGLPIFSEDRHDYNAKYVLETFIKCKSTHSAIKLKFLSSTSDKITTSMKETFWQKTVISHPQRHNKRELG